jgi:hypothetical protein
MEMEMMGRRRVLGLEPDSGLEEQPLRYDSEGKVLWAGKRIWPLLLL